MRAQRRRQRPPLSILYRRQCGRRFRSSMRFLQYGVLFVANLSQLPSLPQGKSIADICFSRTIAYSTVMTHLTAAVQAGMQVDMQRMEIPQDVVDVSLSKLTWSIRADENPFAGDPCGGAQAGRGDALSPGQNAQGGSRIDFEY